MLVRKPATVADRRVVTLQGNLEQLGNVEDFVLTADFIVHVAAESRLLGGSDYEGINVGATKQLVDMARRGAVLQRFIYVSSIAAMGRSGSDRCDGPLTIDSPCSPRGEYGISKRKAEEIILASDLPFTIFRPGFIYGPGIRDDSHLRKFALQIRKGLPLHRIGFPGKISLIHVDDLAAAVTRCLGAGVGTNRIYLAGTESMTLGDALAILGESLTGRKRLQFHIPAFRSLLQRAHGLLPAVLAGMFLDYFWMDDLAFRDEFIASCHPRFLKDCVDDITRSVNCFHKL
jgi:nucleoside-diphosphate-sugar epimerase